VLAAHNRVLGPECPDTLATVGTLANTLFNTLSNMGDWG
jgi:hypothetical protein